MTKSIFCKKTYFSLLYILSNLCHVCLFKINKSYYSPISPQKSRRNTLRWNKWVFSPSLLSNFLCNVVYYLHDEKNNNIWFPQDHHNLKYLLHEQFPLNKISWAPQAAFLLQSLREQQAGALWWLSAEGAGEAAGTTKPPLTPVITSSERVGK